MELCVLSVSSTEGSMNTDQPMTTKGDIFRHMQESFHFEE